MKKRVYVDAFLYDNLGDDLFVDLLTRRYKDVQFVTVSHFYQPVTDNITVISSKLLKKVLGYDLSRLLASSFCQSLIVIGGSIFMEGESGSKKHPENILYSRFKEYFILGANFGPYKNEEYRKMYEQIFREARDVCFRDSNSAALFPNLNLRHESDLVFALKDEIDRIPAEKKKQVFISVMDLGHQSKDYEKKTAQLAAYYHSLGYEIVLSSFCRLQQDEQAAQRIQDLLDFPCRMVHYRKDRQEILQAMKESERVIGTRFHSIILGLLMEKPAAAISYSDKTKNFLKDIERNFTVYSLQEFEQTKPEELVFNQLEPEKIESLVKSANRQFEKLDEVFL